jgi:predicted GNAT family acetyltransferase
MAVLRRVRVGDGNMLRDVRLRALRSDPSAFGSTYEREVGLTDDDWESWAVRAADGPAQYLVVAEQDDRLVAMAGAYQPEGDANTRRLYGMWVSPDSRGMGIGGRLVAAVKQWSIQSGASEISLWVVKANETARRIYLKSGFYETEETQPLPSNPELIEVRMILPLD